MWIRIIILIISHGKFSTKSLTESFVVYFLASKLNKWITELNEKEQNNLNKFQTFLMFGKFILLFGVGSGRVIWSMFKWNNYDCSRANKLTFPKKEYLVPSSHLIFKRRIIAIKAPKMDNQKMVHLENIGLCWAICNE